MDGRYEFEGAEVLPLIEESKGARARLWTEAQRYVKAGVDLHSEEVGDLDAVEDQPETGAPPGLWLMNDRGIYLRSNAADGGDRVAWASSYRADVQVGDEAICEFVDAETLAPLQESDTLVVTLLEDKVRLSVVRD